MNPVEPADLVDIREQLHSGCHIVQAKGFSFLANRIINKELDAKDEKKYRKLLFDCFVVEEDILFRFLIDTLPILLIRGSNSPETLWEEFTLRAPRIRRIQRAFGMMISHCKPSFSKFLDVAARIDSEILTKICISSEFGYNFYQYIAVLSFTGLLSDSQKRLVGNCGLAQNVFLKHQPDLYPTGHESEHDPESFLRECSAEDLLSHPLHNIDPFQRHKLMRDRPAVLESKNLPNHILYLPYAVMLSQYKQVIVKLVEQSKMADHKLASENRVSGCRDTYSFAAPDFSDQDLTFETFMYHTIATGKVTSFIKYVENYHESLGILQKAHLLPALTVFLTHSSTNPSLQERICKLIALFVKKAPENADQFVLYFITLYQKPFFPIHRHLLLETIKDLFVNRFVISSAFGFLKITACLEGDRVRSLECLAEIIPKFTQLFEPMTSLCALKRDDGSDESFYAELHLLKECCKVTEDNEKALSKISNSLKECTGPRLAAIVDAVTDLIKCGVLDTIGARSMLTKRARQRGCEQSLGTYCRLLSTSTIPEENEEQARILRMSCIEELANLKQNDNHTVASEAWRSLGAFELDELEKGLKINPAQFATLFVKLRKEVQNGFIDFLSLCLHKEVESYQRPLYNTSAQDVNVSPLLTKVDTFKDKLIIENKNEPWFWSASLSLSASILQLTGPTNRAQASVRLLQSCLENVVPASSHDEMIRLMAGWRICIREVLHVLTESKSNDILWARDQIINTGRTSLTNKAESVDNIMMMLTALADAIDQQLRNIENDEQVEEVSKAQNPWLLSVYEFVATRLPKNLKEKRVAKNEPIYQLITHSNKSSLLTAIFCLRLLYLNPSVAAFYNDEDVGLTDDRMLVSLLQDSTKELKKEEIPDRKMMWVTAEAYGASQMSAKAFEVAYNIVIDEKTEKYEETELVDDESIEKFFNGLISSPKKDLKEIEQNNKKVLEKLWNNGNNEVRRKIYEGLAELALISGTGRSKMVIPAGKLPEGILKGILQLFDKKINVKPETLRNIIRCLVNHRRNDGRFLPPIDWMKFLERSEWTKADTDARLAMITLACEQNISEVIFHFSSSLTVKELLVLSENLRSVSKLFPRKEFTMILVQMAVQARKEDVETSKKLSMALSDLQKDSTVHNFLMKCLPKLFDISGITDPILNSIKDPDAFGGQISNCFDVWLEARRGEKMNIRRICDIFGKEESNSKKNAICALISHESRTLSRKMRFEKLLDVITASRIARTFGGSMQSFFSIFLSIIVSNNDTVEIPLCWFENQEHVPAMMIAAKQPFYKWIVEAPEMKSNAHHFGSFLSYYVDGPEKQYYEYWHTEGATDLLAMIVSAYPNETFPNLLTQTDEFWKSLLGIADVGK